MKNMIKKLLARTYYGAHQTFIAPIAKKIRISLANRIIRKNDYYNLPIYIISFNRLEYLKSTIEWLEKYGYKNIHIIDNKSTYKPLLEYYKNCKYKIFKMKKNYGRLVFYKCWKFIFKRNLNLFILTDPDLYPIDECPNNFVEIFVKAMKQYPEYSKVGFSLKIDDLPNDYYLKNEVIEWESGLYKNVIHNYDGVLCYDSEIDTTFALNSPSMLMNKRNFYKAIRIGYPYQLRHLPWYQTTKNDELSQYLDTKPNDVSNWDGNLTKEEIKQSIKELSDRYKNKNNNEKAKKV